MLKWECDGGIIEAATLDDFIVAAVGVPGTINMMIESAKKYRAVNDDTFVECIAEAAIVYIMSEHASELLHNYKFPLVDFSALRGRIKAEIEKYLGCGHA